MDIKGNKMEINAGERVNGKNGQQNIDGDTAKIYGGDYPLDPMTGTPGIKIGVDNLNNKDVMTNKPGIKGGRVASPTTATNKVSRKEKLTTKINKISVIDGVPRYKK